MKKLLIVLFAICLISCDFEVKSFAEIGGILYTFQLPKNATQADIDELQAIFKKRIRSYVRQKPTFKYDKEKQQLSVGVPKSLTSKNPDLCRKLLTADGSMLMIKANKSYSDINQKLEKINLSIEKEPIKIDGELSEQKLFDVLELIPSQQIMYCIGVSTISDTGLAVKMIQHERFQNEFEKDLIWAWKVNKHEMKAYLHAYSMQMDKISEKNIEKIKIGKPQYDYPTLNIDLDEEGTRIFEKMTTEAAPTKSLIYIFVSQQLIISPVVQTPIAGGRVQITGSDMEDVIFMKSIIEAGRLPVFIELIGEAAK